MSNRILNLCSNQLPGVVFNSAVNSKSQLAIESKNGEITSFSVYDLITGKLLSENRTWNLSPWHSLSAIDETSIILSYFENKQNPDQVSFIRYDPEIDQLGDVVDKSSIGYPMSHYPRLFLPESEGFQIAVQFLAEQIVLGCEYLELEEVIILSYYLPTTKGFDRKLLVLKNGKEVVHEVQDKGMTGFASGSFFTFQDRLIFVRDMTELNIYEI